MLTLTIPMDFQGSVRHVCGDHSCSMFLEENLRAVTNKARRGIHLDVDLCFTLQCAVHTGGQRQHTNCRNETQVHPVKTSAYRHDPKDSGEICAVSEK